MFKKLKTTIVQWIVNRWQRTVNSIAFLPAVIAFFFLVISVVMIYFDHSALGQQIKSDWNALRLRDASTARSIISAITAGIISLTVFSFSMVMIVLNQAASQMSNRVLDKLIGNRFQQIILGFYIGTIVYALFLLSTIRDIDSELYVPSLSTYLLIVLTIIDIFLFIYFLHYITQSVKYEVVINRIHDQTKRCMKHSCRLDEEPALQADKGGQPIPAPVTGLFTGFNKDGLLKALKKKNCGLTFLYPLGSFVLEDAPLLTLAVPKDQIEEEWVDELMLHIFINKEETIEENFSYGLRQLMEVAIRALSPGVNDPGTAITSLRALSDLLAYRLKHFPSNIIRDEDGLACIVTNEPSFERLFALALFPIWDYGKNDRMVQYEMHHVLTQMQAVQPHPAISKLLVQVHHQRSGIE